MRHRQRQICQHQDVSVVMPPALCTWVSSPTGILAGFKVLNWRSHHDRHTHLHAHTRFDSEREKRRNLKLFSE